MRRSNAPLQGIKFRDAKSAAALQDRLAAGSSSDQHSTSATSKMWMCKEKRESVTRCDQELQWVTSDSPLPTQSCPRELWSSYNPQLWGLKESHKRRTTKGESCYYACSTSAAKINQPIEVRYSPCEIEKTSYIVCHLYINNRPITSSLISPFSWAIL